MVCSLLLLFIHSFTQIRWDIIGNHDLYGTSNPVYAGNYSVSGQAIYYPVRKLIVNDSQTGEHTFIAYKTSSPFMLWPSLAGYITSDNAATLRTAIAEQTALKKPAIVIGHHPLNMVFISLKFHSSHSLTQSIT